MGRSILTAAERRLAALLFGLSLLGVLARGGARLSPEVRAWLDDSTAAPAPGPEVPLAPVPAAPVAEASQPSRAEGTVDPNHADAAGLEALPGVGPVLAARIVEDRARHGPYRRPEDLLRVPGLGPATLARLRAHLSIE